MAALSWQVGEVTITRVPEVVVDMTLGELLPEATAAALARYREWLAPHFLRPDGKCPLSIHGLVVQVPAQRAAGERSPSGGGDLRILVDTCLGQHEVPGFEDMRAGAEDFLAGLAAAGHPRESIDVVLCTHLHFDHVGWNTMRVGDRWVPTFPNARYLFARAEWEHWSNGGDDAYASTSDLSVRPILDAGLADLVDPDHKICDAVRLVPTAGHTPGHVSVEISSQGERAFITGDMTHHPVQWAEPDWQDLFDVDSAVAAATRRRIGAALADTAVLVIGTHYAPPCAGHLVRGSDGIWFRARS